MIVEILGVYTPKSPWAPSAERYRHEGSRSIMSGWRPAPHRRHLETQKRPGHEIAPRPLATNNLSEAHAVVGAGSLACPGASPGIPFGNPSEGTSDG